MAKGNKKASANNTRVMRCSCVHDYQDYLYGKGHRLHNSNKKGDQYTCTVCGSSKR